MYPKKERVLSLLDAALKEMDLLLEMSKDIHAPDDFVLEIIDALYVDRCNRSIWLIQPLHSSAFSRCPGCRYPLLFRIGS